MFKTLKNAWRIPELRSKLLFTLLIIVLYRLGANIPVPYVNPQVFEDASAVAGAGILYYLNLLSGEALGRATLFALGVSPYITSSIVVQLLTVAFPNWLGKWAKEGPEGQKKITAFTRIVTVVLAFVTAIGYAFYLDGQGFLVVEKMNWFSGSIIVACYCAGAALVMWLAEKINEHGIGNGISIILFANIVVGLFGIAQSIWNTVFTMGGFSGFKAWGLVIAIVEIVILLGMIMLIVWMSDAERRIPIQYAKRVVGRKMYGGQGTNLPLKVNMTGVMPIIFASSIASLPATLAAFFPKVGWLTWIADNFSYDSWIYVVINIILIVAFSYFYVMISFNPVEVANNIKDNGGSIPGIRPGKPTSDYIKKVLNRITTIGAIFLCFISCFPMVVAIIAGYFEWNIQGIAQLAFGGTSLLIVIGVALETVRELEAQMTLRNYKGFLD